jgi:hypothetical protein
MKREEKYDKEWKVITEKLEEDKVKRTVERVILVVSSLGARHKITFSGAKMMLRKGKDNNQDKLVSVILF